MHLLFASVHNLSTSEICCLQALAAEDGAGGVSLELSEEERPGYYAAVNERLELAEVGWAKFPKLMTLGWAAQWLQYEAELRQNLSRPALVVPVFEDEVWLSSRLQGPVQHC